MTLQRPCDPHDRGPGTDPPELGPRDPLGPVAPAPHGFDGPLSTNALSTDDTGADTAPVVSGRVGTWDKAELLRLVQLDEGFAPSDVEVFHTGPAGRHAVMAMGGDSHADAGSTHIATGASAGAAAGAAIGLAVGAAVAMAPVVGPVLLTAAAVGAFGGALAGGLSASEDGSTKPDTAEHPVGKPGGVVVAVRIDGLVDGESTALRRMHDGGAITLERATARWRDSSWIDWNPTTPREQIAREPGPPQA
jgi:hypothetical protein